MVETLEEDQGEEENNGGVESKVDKHSRGQKEGGKETQDSRGINP